MGGSTLSGTRMRNRPRLKQTICRGKASRRFPIGHTDIINGIIESNEENTTWNH